MTDRIISIASQKGGVGKSTTALNLGFSLSSMGYSVLLLDGDPQGGLSLGTNIRDKQMKGFLDIISGQAQPQECIVKARNGKLSSCSSGKYSLQSVRKFDSTRGQVQAGEIVKKMSEGYDYTLLDCPAGIGPVVRALVSISDSVLVPLNMRNTSVRSLPVFLEFLKDIKGRKKNPGLEGILVTMLDYASRTELEIFKSVKEQFNPKWLFSTVIKHDYLYEDISINAIPAGMSSKAVKASRNYFELALELREREIVSKSGENEDEEVQGLF
ncbi:MAG: ParA family protein [Deltaproteobacteria bacterium]|nr:ParA family protein [Deltaproteobacteria bacterium]